MSLNIRHGFLQNDKYFVEICLGFQIFCSGYQPHSHPKKWMSNHRSSAFAVFLSYLLFYLFIYLFFFFLGGGGGGVSRQLWVCNPQMAIFVIMIYTQLVAKT